MSTRIRGKRPNKIELLFPAKKAPPIELDQLSAVVTSPECLALAKAFIRIGDVKLRRQIIDVVSRIAEYAAANGR